MRIQLQIIFPILVLFLVSCNEQKTIHPVKKKLVESVYASGIVLAGDETNIFSLTSGTIIKKFVKDGDSVKKGQILYEISNDAAKAKTLSSKELLEKSLINFSNDSPVLKEMKLSLNSAETKFSNDSTNLIKYKKLFEASAVSKQQLDNAQLSYNLSYNERQSASERYHSTLNNLKIALANAKSQLVNDQTELDHYQIKSDRDCIIYKTFKEEGEAVRTMEIVAIAGIGNIKLIKMAVDQQDIDKIKLGQEVILKTDISGDKIYKGSVIKIYPMMNEADQTFRVDADLSSNENINFIHSSVEANIIIQVKENCLVIPRNLMINDDSLNIFESGKIKKIAIKIGISTLEEVEIISGLSEKSELVIQGKK